MKLIISSQGNKLESKPSSRFGRAPYFILYDLSSNHWTAFPNQGVSEQGGAGVAASQLMIDQGVNAIISGRFGRNAFQVLDAADIPMWIFDSENQTIQEVIESFKSGLLKKVSQPR